ncbi:CRAL/TRIO domain-containing protein [Basidiobolus meristosporus CBS 931.73]|uniref:CRAL/TRIO domain-containing protein n=1 Tax=Basidiobolus meristosporus CBS 931.73 TaxID=1314790 RepID=A0A1Y1WT45_9FUNG|nr:CRAL/TRIO domain-containing protein [Basidiobolus meristosporus CBS 931.73]|eukprot:ORX76711.1 CRAL/TRIO domain-containing protein [Basidiobolus meristosporus CBS 931.73]
MPKEPKKRTGFLNSLEPEQKVALDELWKVLIEKFETNEVEETESPTENTHENNRKSGFGKFFNRNKTEKEEPKQTKATPEPETPANQQTLRESFWRFVLGDHPDSILLRYLRARKFNVSKASKMLLGTLKWRIQNDVSGIIEKGEKIVSTHVLQIGKGYLYGVDKEGRPVSFCHVRLHNKDDEPIEELEKFTIWLMETARLFLIPPADCVSVVFDMKDFSLSNMDYPFVSFMNKVLESHYPESLGVALILGAPWVFSGVWKVVSPLLDPVVASKVQFLDKYEDLQKFIEPSMLLKQFGGQNPYEFKFVPPQPGENDIMNDTEAKNLAYEQWWKSVDQFEKITATRLASPSPEVEQQREAAAKQLRADYFKLDPYIRARTVYHRVGILHNDGSVHW